MQSMKDMDEYLDNLAIAVDNLRMCFDCEVVLGGYVGNLIGTICTKITSDGGGK